MPRAILAVPSVIALLAAAVPGALACEADTRLAYNAPARIEGTLKEGSGQHEAQGAFKYSYVQLDKPVCVDAAGGDEFNVTTAEPVDRFQVAGDAAAKDLPVGARVAVEGTLFGAHTMWHVEDVLIDAASLAQQ
jgi:hypothetical protein